MSTRPEGYVPAAGHDDFLRFYDPALRWLVREVRWRREIVARAELPPRARVLDVGCGTGTQALFTVRAHPDAQVTGIDGDAKALAIARRKLDRAGVAVTLDEGLATALPYPDARFDRVISTFVFHHLDDADKRRAASEIRRVLAPGGVFLLVDFGAPQHWLERLSARLLVHAEHARTNLAGGMRPLLEGAGFPRVDEVAQRSLGFGRIYAWRATAT
jgi:ubiquinone/menaquinone biosynthesis C-methylase UbiE